MTVVCKTNALLTILSLSNDRSHFETNISSVNLDPENKYYREALFILKVAKLLWKLRNGYQESSPSQSLTAFIYLLESKLNPDNQ